MLRHSFSTCEHLRINFTYQLILREVILNITLKYIMIKCLNFAHHLISCYGTHFIHCEFFFRKDYIKIEILL